MVEAWRSRGSWWEMELGVGPKLDPMRPQGAARSLSFSLKHMENYQRILEVNNMIWFTSGGSYYYSLNINCN